MIKLKSKDDKYYWIHGTRAMTYIHEARIITGKKSLCKTNRQAIKGCAYTALHTALSCIEEPILYSITDANGYEKIVNISLPACIQDAVKIIEDTCLAHGKSF